MNDTPPRATMLERKPVFSLCDGSPPNGRWRRDPAAGRAQRARRGGPVGMAGERLRCAERTGRAVDCSARVRRRVRSLDGLRGVPGLAHARAMDSPTGRVRSGRRRDHVHRPRDHRRRGDHGLRVAVVDARRPPDDQGVRLRLAVALALDALVVRCVLLPAVLEPLGALAWRLPRRLDARLPHVNIEGAAARRLAESRRLLLPPRSGPGRTSVEYRCSVLRQKG